MIKIKTFRRKHAPYKNKWECYTPEGHYAIIRVKEGVLDVRIAPSYGEFVLGGGRIIYIAEFKPSKSSNDRISPYEIFSQLGIEVVE